MTTPEGYDPDSDERAVLEWAARLATKKARWLHHTDGQSPAHVWPFGDLIDHDTETDDCPCGPRPEAVRDSDGSVSWVVVHHALDGRERSEDGEQ